MLGIFQNFSDFGTLFDDFRCCRGWAFSDSLVQLTFLRNENVSGKPLLQFFAYWAGWGKCPHSVHSFGVACSFPFQKWERMTAEERGEKHVNLDETSPLMLSVFIQLRFQLANCRFQDKKTTILLLLWYHSEQSVSLLRRSLYAVYTSFLKLRIFEKIFLPQKQQKKNTAAFEKEECLHEIYTKALAFRRLGNLGIFEGNFLPQKK